MVLSLPESLDWLRCVQVIGDAAPSGERKPAKQGVEKYTENNSIPRNRLLFRGKKF
jgi:hypothetical protein